jgi:glutathione S-transferase
MSLVLYYHPLASYCHKVLIALYENETPFERRVVELSDTSSAADLFRYWPLGKIPLLYDRQAARAVPETSIIVEYLAQHHPGPVRLIPEATAAALDVRLWDRFFDLYVQTPMQTIVSDQRRPRDRRDSHAVDEAEATLHTAYKLLEKQLRETGWVVGDAFSLADCAAAPALFYAYAAHPFSELPRLSAYFERLRLRPSVARAIAEAAPHLEKFPLLAALPEHFVTGQPL